MKNPLSLDGFENQSKSLGGLLERLNVNPQYQKMTPKQRVALRSQVYDQFIPAMFSAAGLKPPDKKEWLKFTIEHKSAFFNYAQDFALGVPKGVLDVAQMGIDAVKRWQKVQTDQDLHSQQVFKDHLSKQHGLDQYFKGASNDTARYNNPVQNATRNVFEKAEKGLQDSLSSTNFWINSRPRDGVISNLAVASGEMVAQLPLYEALGGPIEELAAPAIEGTGWAARKVPLTARLLKTPTGKFVGKRLAGATNAFATGLVISGGDTEQAKSWAEADLAFGTVLGLFGKAGGKVTGSASAQAVGRKVASNSVIKAFTAKIAAMGGKPFAEAITDQSVAEMSGQGHGIEEIMHGPQEKYQAGNVTIGQDQHMLGDVAIAPGKEGDGHFIHEGQIYPFTKENRDDVYNSIVRKVQEERKESDPILHDLQQSENVVLNTIANDLHGKDFMDLTKKQMEEVIEHRATLTQESLYEAPVHNPDLVHGERKAGLEKEAAANPELAANLKMLKDSLGIDAADVEAENVIEDTAIQTGLKSSSSATAKAGAARSNAIKAAKAEKYGLKEGASASFNVKNFLSYKRNISTKANRLASDGTLIGRRGKSLARLNTEEFIEELKGLDPHGIKFENSFHELLFHWSNRKQLNKPLRDKVLRELKKDPKFGGDFAKEYNSMADQLGIHLYTLALDGRLSTEGNVFKSTNLSGRPTEWQTDLSYDLAKKELNYLSKTMKNFPGGMKALKSAIIVLQDTRAKSLTNPRRWADHNKAIQNLITGVVE